MVAIAKQLYRRILISGLIIIIGGHMTWLIFFNHFRDNKHFCRKISAQIRQYFPSYWFFHFVEYFWALSMTQALTTWSVTDYMKTLLDA